MRVLNRYLSLVTLSKSIPNFSIKFAIIRWLQKGYITKNEALDLIALFKGIEQKSISRSYLYSQKL